MKTKELLKKVRLETEMTQKEFAEYYLYYLCIVGCISISGCYSGGKSKA